MRTLVDDEDLTALSQHSWHAWYCGSIYARMSKQKNLVRKFIPMHRFLMQPPEGMVVDHINHDTLDNRRSNLRVVTPLQNHRNRRPVKAVGSVTKLAGKRTKQFQARLRGRYIGSFTTVEEGRVVLDALLA